MQCLVAQTAGPSFGTIVALGGTPYDSVVDELRSWVYFVNSSAGRIDIYDYAAKRLAGNIRVDTFPAGAVMSMDGGTLGDEYHELEFQRDRLEKPAQNP